MSGIDYMSLFDSDYNNYIPEMADDNQNPMFEAITAVNTNLAHLGSNRVPPPSTYNGSTSVATFFRQFEVYCTSIYGGVLYLRRLPRGRE